MNTITRSPVALGVAATFCTATLAETPTAQAAPGDYSDTVGHFVVGMAGAALTLGGLVGIGGGAVGLGSAVLAAVGIGAALMPVGMAVAALVVGTIALSVGWALLKDATGYPESGSNTSRSATTILSASVRPPSLGPGGPRMGGGVSR